MEDKKKIKTRKQTKDIKALDKSVGLGTRMKDSYIRAKERTGQIAGESRSETAQGCAAEQMEGLQDEVRTDAAVAARTIGRQTVKEGKKQVQRCREKVKDRQEPDKPLSTEEVAVADSPPGPGQTLDQSSDRLVRLRQDGKTGQNRKSPATPGRKQEQPFQQPRTEGRDNSVSESSSRLPTTQQRLESLGRAAKGSPIQGTEIREPSAPAEPPLGQQMEQQGRQLAVKRAEDRAKMRGAGEGPIPSEELRRSPYACPSPSNSAQSPASNRVPTTRGQETVKLPGTPKAKALPAQRTPVTPKVKTRTVGRKGPGAANGVKQAANQTAKMASQKATKKTAQAARTAANNARKAATTTAKAIGKAVVAAVKAGAGAIGALVGIFGGGVVLVILLIIIVIAAVVASPFGIFFAQESDTASTVSVAQAMGIVAMDYNTKLASLQTSTYDNFVLEGSEADWNEVLAVFAVRYAASEDEGIDVATLDTDRQNKLKGVFWDMNQLTTEVETAYHPDTTPDDGVDSSWTEYTLRLILTPKTADEMRTQYSFSDWQNDALDELLAKPGDLTPLRHSLLISDYEAQTIIQGLPYNLSADRRSAVQTALSLVGKVTYFWGGKSPYAGWNDRWGCATQVTAAGSPTTGTYRPYGLDCTGFIDWTLRNCGLPSDGHWFIGTNLVAVTESQALPGDLALYPDSSHIGMVVGRDADGKLLICHCSSGANNVVVTECSSSGFTAIGRPSIYN